MYLGTDVMVGGEILKLLIGFRPADLTLLLPIHGRASILSDRLAGASESGNGIGIGRPIRQYFVLCLRNIFPAVLVDFRRLVSSTTMVFPKKSSYVVDTGDGSYLN